MKINNGYEGMMVTTYDYSPFLSGKRFLDKQVVEFYANEARKCGNRLLEIGTATGVLTIELARRNFIIDSIDKSLHMHSYVKNKLKNENKQVVNNINLITMDILEYKCNYQYDCIIMPDNLLLAIADSTQQIELLKKIRSMIKPKGKIIFDIFSPDLNLIASRLRIDKSEFYDNTGILHKTQQVVRVDPASQIMRINIIDTRIPDNITEKGTIVFRYINRYELMFLLELTGYKKYDIYSDFYGNKVSTYSSMQVVVAE